MKLLVFSDSHGNPFYMSRALAMHPDAEAVFFLGDGLADITPFVARPSSPTWFSVRGNCDMSLACFNTPILKTDSVTLEGVKIVFTHGDLYRAKYGIEELVTLAFDRDADLVLFGHTHTPFQKYIDLGARGLYLFNPGSIGSEYGVSPSYGIVSLTDGGILLSHGKF